MISHSYYVVMIDYPSRINADGIRIPASREAVVDPEVTRRGVISRIASGEYQNIAFIHLVEDGTVTDVTGELIVEAALPEIRFKAMSELAGRDHADDYRKLEGV